MPIVIELGRENKNVNPFIEPLGEPRRGKWRRSNLPLMNLADADVAGLPDLPGYRISVDPEARRIRVFDPLQSDPRRNEIFAALSRFFKRRVKPAEDWTTEEQTGGKISQWLLAMRRLVQGRNAELLEGEFPDSIEHRLLNERCADAAATGLKPEELVAV